MSFFAFSFSALQTQGQKLLIIFQKDVQRINFSQFHSSKPSDYVQPNHLGCPQHQLKFSTKCPHPLGVISLKKALAAGHLNTQM